MRATGSGSEQHGYKDASRPLPILSSSAASHPSTNTTSQLSLITTPKPPTPTATFEMQFSTILASLASMVAMTSAVSVSYDAGYDDAGRALTAVSCSDGVNGLITKYGWQTQGAIPRFPHIGGAPDIAGWNSANASLLLLHVCATSALTIPTVWQVLLPDLQRQDHLRSRHRRCSRWLQPRHRRYERTHQRPGGRARPCGGHLGSSPS